MERSFAADHSRPRVAVVNENEVRAAAGLTMVIGAVAFSYAYFAKQYVPLQVAASLFFVEFLIRVTIGLRYSPIGVVARAMTLGRAPEWVSAKPKRFAWTLGLAMALAMTIITNSGIRGPLPRTMCLICLTLMWMESALGLCLGCKIYGLLRAARVDRRRPRHRGLRRRQLLGVRLSRRATRRGASRLDVWPAERRARGRRAAAPRRPGRRRARRRAFALLVSQPDRARRAARCR